MEDFQGKYNGKQIDQLLDKANDIDLTIFNKAPAFKQGINTSFGHLYIF